MDLREKFLKIYANIPEDLREDIIVVIEGEPYSWRSSFLEIKDKTDKGNEMIKKLESMNII